MDGGGGITHSVGDVVDHDGGLRSTVIHGRQAMVALLARSVPDLKLHRRFVQTYRLGEEGSWRGEEERRGGEEERRGGPGPTTIVTV